MILVVLGTHELPFTRLLKEVERQIINGNIQDEVIVQQGHTRYQSPYMKMITFTSYEEMERLYREAAFIITHGGTGSITTGVKMGKKMIAAPRLTKYGEHNDDHQLEIVQQFEKTGHILAWYDGEDFGNILKKIDHFEPVPFVSGKNKIISILRTFINEHV
ncbi:PssE/Cps14G family polysaccharide biosynthesis glycosyltransferase [Thermaerobacillus caldiproteolyticus]|uniref:UDP-N-acetylglucosamine transferase subunit ALG13 n=1 Tax=Thermaerobacillus caldiproteolyticus TaxID=247480 RepID=A0A7V9Z619_9BACL|nr:PssE/Cps14G family polysaccharide biosynthesis glycosyltransferase [Anoxybacillus caldiproteolyticus]MBA2874605.1 UDP-N-acetylglucosamine transferase subunit ALG13 [Anoxybacillus caldiproteolyticus]QPA30731.1 exopolysaccharide biosynthesis protein [Anoxybacillus caldiproteolyticus]